MDDKDRVVSPTEAAKLLGVTLKTLRIWASEGKIAYGRTPGGHRRFTLYDINKFLDRKKEWEKIEKTCAIDTRAKTFGEKSIDFGLCVVSMTKINGTFVLEVVPNECLPSKGYVDGVVISFEPTESNIEGLLSMSKNADEVREAKDKKMPIQVFTGVSS